MTIFDQGYSDFRYQPVSPLARIWSLANMEFRKIFRTKKGLMLFVLCVVYVVVLLVLVFINLGPEAARFERGLSQLSDRLSPFKRDFYLSYSTDFGFLFFIALSSVISVRSIAGDRAVNALEIYWTRGITPWGYFIAKWLGSFLLLLSVFLSGPLLAWIYAAISAPSLDLFHTTIPFIPQVMLSLVLKCAILSFLAVGFSGAASSPNIVTFLWLVFMMGTAAFVELMKGIGRMHARNRPQEIDDAPEWYAAINPWDAMVRIEEEIAGVAEDSAYSVWLAVLSLGALSMFILWRLRRCLRTTEAVG